ncbi:MAG: hypothetical protein VX341_00600 [Bdellovibrionota bacterium]|nr:hypothetical protein [Bdellovibrionota bacterium]
MKKLIVLSCLIGINANADSQLNTVIKEKFECHVETVSNFQDTLSSHQSKLVGTRTITKNSELGSETRVNEAKRYRKNSETGEIRLSSTSSTIVERTTESVSDKVIREFDNITRSSTILDNGTFEDGSKIDSSTEYIVSEYEIEDSGKKKLVNMWINNNKIELGEETSFEIETIDGTKITTSFRAYLNQAPYLGSSAYGESKYWTKTICMTTSL